MKKEINYLSLPDYFNKFLLINHNQKINLKDSIKLQFKLCNNHHLGASLKALNLLEIIFPKKAIVLKIVIKKKKLIFGQKSKNVTYYFFDTTLSSIEFMEFFRFFSKNPFNFYKNKTKELFVVNRKFKQFEFNKNIFIVPNNPNTSLYFFILYHLN